MLAIGLHPLAAHQRPREYLLAALCIRQKNGHPGHPQTQGKIERFHQTQKRWLARQEPAGSSTALQDQLDRFRTIYNKHWPHRALDGATPETPAEPPAKPPPTNPVTVRYPVRLDHVDRFGKVTLRRAGGLHHLGVGIDNAHRHVLILTDDIAATVTDPTTGELLSQHHIDPDCDYWRNTQRSPGRWPGLLNMNDDPGHL